MTKTIETEEQRRAIAEQILDRANPMEWTVEQWLEQHPWVRVGMPTDLQAGRRAHMTSPHQIPLSESPNSLTVLNTAILTDWGTYDYRPLTLDEARDMYATYEYGPQAVQSAVGHEATAQILYDLIGESAGFCNRVQYRQPIGAKALVFKLRGRPPEGKILTREEVEAIGYDFGLLTRIS